MERAARVAETIAKNSYLALWKNSTAFLSSYDSYMLGNILYIYTHTEAVESYQENIETKIKFGPELYYWYFKPPPFRQSLH